MNHCPFCQSDDIAFLKKTSLWKCQACNKTFQDKAPAPAAPRLSDKASSPKAIFFSYGHDHHRELVEAFKKDLENRGHYVWFDAKDIGTWEDWKGRITRGIDSSDMAIAFMSLHALRDPGVCRNEIAISHNRFGIVYPVAVEPNIYDDVPFNIRDLQWPDLSQWRAIKDGLVPGQDWERWYEARLIDLVTKIEGKASGFAAESRALREVLRPSSFESRFAQHIPGFIGRDWVFEAYRHWLDKETQSRLFWIKAGPGVGKTAIAANLAARERGTIVASWFCDAKSPELRSPAQAIRSLAYQMALRWEDYRVKLLSSLSIAADTFDNRLDEIAKEVGKLAPQDLFRAVIVEPLANLIWREHKLVIVIDALDEATDASGDNPLTDFLATQLASLPEWVAFVVTSRPDPAVVTRLQGFKPFEIDAQDARNLTDLRTWYRQHLGMRNDLSALPADKQQQFEDLLLQRSEGMILYLKLVEEGLAEQSLGVEGLEKLEAGLPGLYASYAISFQHRFGKDYEQSVKPLVRLLVAAAGPLPEDLACEALGWTTERLHQARLKMGSYVVESPAGLESFHKTLTEWLTRKAENAFYVDPALGRQQIADVLFQELGEKDAYVLRWREPIRRWLTQWWNTLEQRHATHALQYLGNYLHRLGEFGSAEVVLREALSVARTTLQASDPDIATGLNNLADLLQVTGRYDESELLYRQALEIKEAALPVGHPDIATGINNLALLLKATGRYDEAESLYRQALAIWQSAPSAGHRCIATGLNNLADVLQATGRYEEAEPLCRQALDIQEAALPAGHPDIATGINNLAMLLTATGRYDEAESLFRQVMEIQEAALPAGHPDIAAVFSNLGALLKETGRYDEAERLFRQTLEIRKAVLPVRHPYIATSLRNLAELLQTADRPHEAEPLLREVLEIRQAAEPPEHLNIAYSLNNLAVLLQDIGRPEEAEPLYRQALAICAEALPKDHPFMAVVASNLATVLQDTARNEDT